MITLCFDTETTGKANFKLPADDPSQPNVVQLGAVLADSDYKIITEFKAIVRPNGWTIPEEASNIHGITDAIAQEHGLACATVLTVFCDMLDKATRVVAYNIDFDDLVMRTFANRTLAGAGLNSYGTVSKITQAGRCVMKAMTPICKLPGMYDDYKWPKLSEAYDFAFHEKFNAHDAMADVRACLRLDQWLRQGKTSTERPMATVSER